MEQLVQGASVSALVDSIAQADPAIPLDVDRQMVEAFAAAVLRRVGARRGDASVTGKTLVLADVRGHPSHGLSRLGRYVDLLAAGALDGEARHVVRTRRSALETWDAQHGLGPAVGHRAMARAISKARRSGLAAVTVRDGGHFGIAGSYVADALAAGMIGIAACNADPQVRPTGAAVKGTGTNPIAVGAPDGRGRGILLDMATSTVALGKIEVARKAGKSIPRGWSVTADGADTTDPDEALAGALLPLGGRAATSGYKGFGLAQAVEILTSVLGGGIIGTGVSMMNDATRPASTSQFHLAIDPAAVGEPTVFFERVSAYVDQLKSLPREAGVDEILVAGEKEWRAEERQAERVGLLPEVLLELAAMAEERGATRAWRPVLRSLA